MADINYTNSVISFGDDDAITDVYTYEAFPLGLYREENGKGYRFFKYDNGTGNLTLAAGDVLYQVDSDPWIMTKDVSDSDINLVGGVAVSVVADAGYGWMATFGPGHTVNTNGDDNIAKGDSLIGAGDGTCDSVAQDTAPTNRVIGWATEADTDAANTVVAFLTLE